jgi:hypothetical protein
MTYYLGVAYTIPPFPGLSPDFFPTSLLLGSCSLHFRPSGMTVYDGAEHGLFVELALGG